MNDKAEAVLAVAGTPLTPEEIQTRIGEDYSLVGIRNQLTADERFLRLDRNKYGLARWGGEEYLGIREMIAREIVKAGGEASVNTIVASLTSRYEVSESSVRAYAGGPGFERTQRGWIRVAGAEPADYQPRRDVSNTRRCFRSRDGPLVAPGRRERRTPARLGFPAADRVRGPPRHGTLAASSPPRPRRGGGDLVAQPADDGLDPPDTWPNTTPARATTSS